MDSISFPAVEATNLPLGSQSQRNPNPDLIIDLTSEDNNQPMANTPATRNSINNTSNNTPVLEDDDDIIFTGEHPPPSNPSQPSVQPRPSNSRSSNQLNPSNLSDRVATLTANIYAGFYSRNLRTDPPPQQGSSNLTIRESPALQTRNTAGRPINFGGGGRFSGGRFSGFLAAGFNAGLSGIRSLTEGSMTRTYHQREENLEDMLSNWGTNEFHRFDPGDRPPPTRFMNPQLHGNFLALSPHEIFAAIYDFDQTQPREPIQPGYKETDSHPLKIKPGFSKVIIPLDREVLSLDSDSPSDPLPEKQDLRPVCASCDEDLLMSQDSCSGDPNGRRPWILACGHVVDYRCLEKARIRAQEIKSEFQLKKEKTKPSTVTFALQPSIITRGRLARNNQSQTHDLPKSSNSKTIPPSNKRRKLSLTNTSNPKSPSPATSTISDLALKRKERAEAREARKSAEFIRSSTILEPQPHLTQSDSKATDQNNTINTEQTNTEQTNTHHHNHKGKGKAREVSQIPTDPRTLSGSNEDIQHYTTTAHHSIGSSNHSPLKPALAPSELQLSWIKCPVKGCRVTRGDILAPSGSKNAPWEMFV